MQMSSRVNKIKHTVRPVTKPSGKKTRFDKPAKIRRQKPDTFTDLSQLKERMEEAEMRMGGTSVNAAKIIKEVTQEKPKQILIEETDDMLNETISIINDTLTEVNCDTPNTHSHKVGLFGALCLGIRDTLFGQAITAVTGH